MKIKEGFVLRQIADQWMVVPIGSMAEKIHGLIALNETAADIWKILEDDHTSGGCRMVLDYLGNRTSDSEKDKKSRNCRFGGAGDRSIDHKCGTQKHHCKNPPV